jgi:hypothetical protein
VAGGTPLGGLADAGTVLAVASGETGQPVAGARVTVAGQVLVTDGEGRAALTAPAPLQSAVEIDAEGFLPRRAALRDAAAPVFTLWPGRSHTGLDADYSGWLVYTSAASHDAPHGAQALQRLPLSARQVSVVPSDELRRDALAWTAHEEAVRMMNEALGGRLTYVLAAHRGGGVLFETKLDGRSAHCREGVRAVTTASLRGDEISGGTVVFCTLEAARSFTVAHELGHTFGLQHSPHGAEIMYGWFLPHHPAGFSPREALAMSLMLQREPGNRFPDTDRATGASGERRTVVTVCR